MSTLYRGPPIDAFYQVSVHLAKRFQKRNFFKISQLETSVAWRQCSLTDRDEMSNLYRGLSINGFYQVSVHLIEGF
jgi:hypothetical protein